MGLSVLAGGIPPPCGRLGTSALCIFPMGPGSEKQHVTDFPGFRIPSTILWVLFIIYRLFHWSSNVCEAFQPQRRVSYLILSFFKLTSAHIADRMAEIKRCVSVVNVWLDLGFASLKKIFFLNLFLAVLDFHCSVVFFSSCGEWGCSLVAMCGLLIVVAFLVVEHRL